MGKKEWKKIRHGIIIFVMAFFSAIPFVVYGKILIPKKQSVLEYIDYGGFIDRGRKLGVYRNMAWNCWIRSLSIPDRSTICV